MTDGCDCSLILYLALHVVDCVGRLYFKRDRLPCKPAESLQRARKGIEQHLRLDEDLHASSQTENQVEGRFLLDVVI